MTHKPKPIDVDKIDLDKMKEKTADLPALLEYAHSIGGFSIVPTEQGVIKASAMNAMKEQTQMQLDQIFEQMQLLAKQAKQLKSRAEISSKIYESDMGFDPVIGQKYYLYEKKDNNWVLSIIHPGEWRKLPYEKFIAEVQLLADHTWKVISPQDSDD